MNTLHDDIRHERERGLILEVLIKAELRPIPFRLLHSIVVAQGFPIEAEGLDFHLTYLKDTGYIEIKNLRDGRVDVQMKIVRATRKAVDLRDGRIAADVGIRFE